MSTQKYRGVAEARRLAAIMQITQQELQAAAKEVTEQKQSRRVMASLAAVGSLGFVMLANQPALCLLTLTVMAYKVKITLELRTLTKLALADNLTVVKKALLMRTQPRNQQSQKTKKSQVQSDHALPWEKLYERAKTDPQNYGPWGRRPVNPQP